MPLPPRSLFATRAPLDKAPVDPSTGDSSAQAAGTTQLQQTEFVRIPTVPSNDETAATALASALRSPARVIVVGSLSVDISHLLSSGVPAWAVAGHDLQSDAEAAHLFNPFHLGRSHAFERTGFVVLSLIQCLTASLWLSRQLTTIQRLEIGLSCYLLWAHAVKGLAKVTQRSMKRLCVRAVNRALTWAHMHGSVPFDRGSS